MFILEGNIGAGKSTFLKLVAQHLHNVQVVLEPIATWQQPVNGQSIFENFLTDTPRWAYSFETVTMMCRVKDHLAQQQTTNLKILERSIYSGHYCFAQNGFNQNFMSTLEWEVYNQWFNFLVPTKCKAPQGFIYLQTDPAIAHARIQKRNRSGENAISLAYLEQLHQRHESFLVHKQDVLPELKQVPLLVLDCNQEFEADSAVFARHLQQVKNFIQYAAAPQQQSHGFPQLVPHCI